jgi:hypothetical protein
MLADPGGVQADPLGVQRLIDDIGNELVGPAAVVPLVVIAEHRRHCKVGILHSNIVT